MQHKCANYESVVRKLLPSVLALDPDQVPDFSQYQEMLHVCFPAVNQASEEYDGQSIMQMNEKL